VWQFDTSPCHRVVISAFPAFRSAIESLGITVVADEPLARHTTFHIGGPADLYAAVSRITELERLAEAAATHHIPTTILGGGSNILASDAGVCGLVIANQTRDFGVRVADCGLGESDLQPFSAASPAEQATVAAASGVALAGLARWTIKNGWTGLEWAVSVPGTVGGAVIGNAGAHGGDIASNLAWVLVAYPGWGRRLLAREALEFSYRSSVLKQQISAGQRPVVLAAGFRLQAGDVIESIARADGFLAKRRAGQPVEPSAGSIFRNPPGDYAGRLLEAAGLKGVRIGGAQVSPRHANFIINTGHARAADVVALIDLMRSRVFQQFGVELIPEIVFVGDWAQRPPYAPLSLAL
jgi:UDP-N-acetylmuramate dehydrogenase